MINCINSNNVVIMSFTLRLVGHDIVRDTVRDHADASYRNFQDVAKLYRCKTSLEYNAIVY